MTLAVLLSALLAQVATPAPPPPSAPAVVPPHLMSRVPTGWTSLSERERAEFIAGDVGRPLPERLLRVSERFLGTPYVHSPLGEGDGVDPDPTFRLDAVDCLTFVEQSLAMSLARSEEEVAGLLERLRYANAPTYEERNHLMEAQWLPNNQRKGFLLDVTRSVGGADTVRVNKTLTALSWKSPSSMALGLPKERQVQGMFELDMIPLERVMTHARRVPSGSILIVLREDMPYKATRVTHLGFVVQKGKRTWLRHARRGLDGTGRVVDEDLEGFLARNAKYDKWKVTGVSFFEALEPAPSSGALVHSE
ncbi:N-acetylmuramoyl-L-alanine amidase-like domain-containing protein [Melittangium boletus]|uniref:Ribose-5-phosphate isomerase n=1 Tax=Melittangium boletus DSM 14713 TaxID=1294270 RepID=A0A250IJS4_9BACT|nr:N-acetylmuramoyl-L-alanine amidase-like domain-containing protein [Melittangium boletus]ATB32059.1 ribose-5-phosphate isomerase [Melittangium boletus DSM 14713]